MGQHGIDPERRICCGLLSGAACFRNAEDTLFSG
jgi:hypothetical protein